MSGLMEMFCRKSNFTSPGVPAQIPPAPAGAYGPVSVAANATWPEAFTLGPGNPTGEPGEIVPKSVSGSVPGAGEPFRATSFSEPGVPTHNPRLLASVAEPISCARNATCPEEE